MYFHSSMIEKGALCGFMYAICTKIYIIYLVEIFLQYLRVQVKWLNDYGQLILPYVVKYSKCVILYTGIKIHNYP